jgi:hypothetical protein
LRAKASVVIQQDLPAGKYESVWADKGLPAIELQHRESVEASAETSNERWARRNRCGGREKNSSVGRTGTKKLAGKTMFAMKLYDDPHGVGGWKKLGGNSMLAMKAY